MKSFPKFLVLCLVAMLAITACGNQAAAASSPVASGSQNVAVPSGQTLSYALESGLKDGKMVFIGVGGEIDGQVNPNLKAKLGDTLNIKLTSGEGAEHDISFPDFNATSEHVTGQGNSVTLSFTVDQTGTFPYFCTLPGHRQAGMEGKLLVADENGSVPAAAAPSSQASQPAAQAASQPPAPAAADAVDIVRDPTDLPGPIGDRGPTTVRVDFEAVELNGKLADGTTFNYWTFNGKVPGPFVRVRVGDTVEVHLKNPAHSNMTHSIDFHAVTGPGGGSALLQTPPGQESVMTFKALHPGLFVYHCTTPMVAEHISNGMFGMILVEPAGGLPRVDHEFYIMQNEIYTTQKFGTQGQLTVDIDKLLNEQPEYFVFNGAVGALTTDHPLKANVGDTVRIYFGVGGPNFISSFHVIGEHLDKVYNLASLTTPPMTDVQTTLVPPGGATVVELKLEVPGKYILVDHALSRLERGLAGYLEVAGPDQPDIYKSGPASGN